MNSSNGRTTFDFVNNPPPQVAQDAPPAKPKEQKTPEELGFLKAQKIYFEQLNLEALKTKYGQQQYVNAHELYPILIKNIQSEDQAAIEFLKNLAKNGANYDIYSSIQTELWSFDTLLKQADEKLMNHPQVLAIKKEIYQDRIKKLIDKSKVAVVTVGEWNGATSALSIVYFSIISSTEGRTLISQKEFDHLLSEYLKLLTLYFKYAAINPSAAKSLYDTYKASLTPIINAITDPVLKIKFTNAFNDLEMVANNQSTQTLEKLARENHLPSVMQLYQKYTRKGFRTALFGEHVRRPLYFAAKIILLTKNVKYAALIYDISEAQLNNAAEEAHQYIKTWTDKKLSQLKAGSDEHQYCLFARWLQEALDNVAPGMDYPDPDAYLYYFLNNATDAKRVTQTHLQKNLDTAIAQGMHASTEWIQNKKQQANQVLSFPEVKAVKELKMERPTNPPAKLNTTAVVATRFVTPTAPTLSQEIAQSTVARASNHLQQPAQQLQQPAQQLQQQTLQLRQPAQRVQQPTQPVQQPAQPVQQPTQQLRQPAQPVQQPTQPVQQPTQQQPAQPSQSAAQNQQYYPSLESSDKLTSDRGTDFELSGMLRYKSTLPKVGDLITFGLEFYGRNLPRQQEDAEFAKLAENMTAASEPGAPQAIQLTEPAQSMQPQIPEIQAVAETPRLVTAQNNSSVSTSQGLSDRLQNNASQKRSAPARTAVML